LKTLGNKLGLIGLGRKFPWEGGIWEAKITYLKPLEGWLLFKEGLDI